MEHRIERGVDTHEADAKHIYSDNGEASQQAPEYIPGTPLMPRELTDRHPTEQRQRHIGKGGACRKDSK